MFPSDQPGQWFSEKPLQGYRQAYKVSNELFRGQSEFQSVAIVETDLLGTTLLLDDTVQTSTLDEFSYHEALVHITLASVRSPERVLIIGGGDGGALRHVLMHSSVKHAVMVEIDGMVIDVCKEHLPELSGGAFDDPRAELIIGDGAKYLAETGLKFDAIIVDLTDPVGAAEVLFSETFFKNARRVLRKRGVYTMQCGSPVTMPTELGRTYRRFGSVFPIARVYLGTVIGYPGILWAYLTGSQHTDPSAIKQARLDRRIAGIETQHYTPAVHRAAFALPARIAAALDDPSEERIGFLAHNPALSVQ